MNESSNQHQAKHAGEMADKKTEGHVAALLVSIALMFLLLALLVLRPEIKAQITRLAGPASVQPMGAVDRVRYVGGSFAQTQVDVGGASLLSVAAVELPRGSAAERHISDAGDSLCLSGTKRCSTIESR